MTEPAEPLRKFGVIDFSHSDPLASFLSSRYEVRRAHPSKILEMVKSGELDLGMVSLVSYLENREALRLVEGPTIHSLSGTISTLLVSSGNPMGTPMKIAVTSHTRTTEFYLDQIMRKLGIRTELIHCDFTEAQDLLEKADYALVIGDEALRAFNSGCRILLDIGRQFSVNFGLPPVYAVTVTASDVKSLPAIDVTNLDAAVEKHDSNMASESSKRVGVSIHLMERYFTSIRYSFTDEVRNTIGFVDRAIH